MKWVAQKKSLNPNILNKLKQIYRNVDLKKSIRYINLTKHRQTTSCAVFAITFAITLALKEQPSTYQYKLYTEDDKHDDVHFLRQHLSQILRNKTLTLFPKLTESVQDMRKTLEYSTNRNIGQNAPIELTRERILPTKVAWNEPKIIEEYTKSKKRVIRRKKDAWKNSSFDLTYDEDCPTPTNRVNSSNNIKYLINEQVLQPFAYINDVLMLKIIKLMRTLSNNEFTTQECRDFADRYVRVTEYANDIQIIFESPPLGARIGHWYTIYRPGNTKRVYVYNSIRNEIVSEHLKNSIYHLYEKEYIENGLNIGPHPHQIIHPMVQQQPDAYCCGIFAVAFATEIILGGDPSSQNYETNRHSSTGERTMELRLHLANILRTENWSVFPRATSINHRISNQTTIPYGLHNPANYCFANSLLQVLLSNTILQGFFFDSRYAGETF